MVGIFFPENCFPLRYFQYVEISFEMINVECLSKLLKQLVFCVKILLEDLFLNCYTGQAEIGPEKINQEAITHTLVGIFLRMRTFNKIVSAKCLS